MTSQNHPWLIELKEAIVERGEKYVQTYQSSLLRLWYRRGQGAYRTILGRGMTPNLDDITGELDTLNDSQRDGFLMGWNSDAYATDHGLGLSVEGSDFYEPENLFLGGAYADTNQT